MDRLIYTAASGAGRVFTAQQVRANNLANINTHGFRADMERAEAYAVQGSGFDSRTLTQAQSAGTRFDHGELQTTGRELDLAIRGDGFFTVELPEGEEAYTRSGAIERAENGDLMIGGLPVLADGGEPVNVPLYSAIEFGDNGIINIVPEGEVLTVEVGRLKLVNPPVQDLSKLENGLFVTNDRLPINDDDSVMMVSGFLEQSNVVAVEEMVASMQLSRNFEMQLKMMQTAEKLAEAGNRLIRA
ncbi:flagellar basal body rod protein FlgF [Photobacterium minamisatsumaniensis]|uniref:flagellar basal body rod protein FlgF n=1 Tax=Photobacterium minamisatsumaniensis TaxID=2910233 RepID=UPI003D0D0C5A